MSQFFAEKILFAFSKLRFSRLRLATKILSSVCLFSSQTAILYERSFYVKKNPAKMFMVASFLVFILTSFVYIGAIMSSVPVVSYPYDDIFHEDSITASQGGEAGSSGAVPTSYKEEGAFLVPVGITTGISFSTDGIMVIGTSDVVTIQGKRASPSCGKLKAGDIIIKINSREVENIGELSQAIENSQKTAKIELMRDGKRLNVDVDVVDSDDNTKKIGCWVRDATQGI
ncbi:MAG: PDZ domain-containing protein, partial [Defluviitaleaceae bacterium]|nr:PDZ domain-containing protein [Defluviitaleaceae bacterium]